MADFRTMRSAQPGAIRTAAVDEGLRAHMNKVYGLMSVGMLVTAAAAYGISTMAVAPNGALSPLGVALYTSPLKWLVMFAPLIFVFAFGAALNRLSVQGATVMFYAFAAVMGISLSSIFLVFTGLSIVTTFLVTAIAFAGLSLWGYTTKKDISGWGSFLIMGVIGLLVASLVNIFLASPAMQFAISAIGVLIFAALTAYDTQNIKNTYLAMRDSGEEFLGKTAIIGALQLYLDFINLFTFLLQFMGQRD